MCINRKVSGSIPASPGYMLKRPWADTEPHVADRCIHRSMNVCMNGKKARSYV